MKKGIVLFFVLLISTFLVFAVCAEETLAVGSKGDDVLEMKRRLQELRYIKDGSLTKKFTDQTQTSLSEFQRMILLRNVDTYWMDHIDAMEDLKKGIHLRSYAQRDPVVAYRMESGDMFEEMTDAIREDTAKMMLTLMPRHRADVQRRAVARVTSTSSSETETNAKQVTIRKEKKIGPNDPCPCGSGKKYKKCHGAPGRSLDELKK